MKVSENELQVLVNTNRMYLDKDTKFKYSAKKLFNELLDISVPFKNWFEGSVSNGRVVGGIISQYELEPNKDFIQVNSTNGATMHVINDYMLTLQVYCLLLLKYNLSNNIELVNVLHSFILSSMGKKASLVEDKQIEELLKMNNLV